MKTFKAALPYLIQIGLCFALAEAGSYWFLLHSNNALYRARRILQADPELGWRAQSSLNTSFEGKAAVTDENGYRSADPDYQLLTLGPSSAFGWGVEAHENYSAVTARELKLPFLNASQIGWSLVQGRRLWEQKIQPTSHAKFALIAYGINDLDKFRFYTRNNESDLEYFRGAPLEFSALVKAERYSNFLTVISLAANEIKFKFGCESLADIHQRVSLQDYESEMLKLVASLQEKGVRPVLVNTPYYLKSPQPAYSAQEIEKRYAAVMQAARENRCPEALQALARAKQLEPDRIAEDTLKLNEVLKKIAAEKQLPYVDAYGILNDQDIALNYVDPVHPSVRGHELIARRIVELLKN